MNAVEIEEAISVLARSPFEPAEFPYAFIQAFGNKATTINRLRAGATNNSDLGGVLQRNHIHIKVCSEGEVATTLSELKASPATVRAKARFILATDGKEFHAEEVSSEDVIVCDYPDFPEHLGFFLPLAGITTVKQIRESAFDIKATGRLNRLYVELLKENPDWGAIDRRHEMNQFIARLILCFFAEDTEIFNVQGLFSDTIERMSAGDSSNTREVISQIFRAMNTETSARAASKTPRWAAMFPFVNGGLFADATEVPHINRLARSYLLHIGNLDWRKINPDIFGSMIQAVAVEEERRELGMHYTSVPNILRVLNPLFLDELRQKLEDAGANNRKLLNLRNRLARIRIFDPACGSGNFLVIAYKEMRAIEAAINKRRDEEGRSSVIPLTNFRGIELRDFAAEIARLALIIAEYQCNTLYRDRQTALAEFLPLDAENWIVCGNALRLDWLTLCPPTGTGIKLHSNDMFETPPDQAEINFRNTGGETYICGNPPYSGKGKKSEIQLSDMKHVLGGYTRKFGYVDYVGCWFLRAAEYILAARASAAFVATNSLCQGRQLPQLWPFVLKGGVEIFFAHHSFKWSNNAARNAGVTCVIIGIAARQERPKTINYGSLSRRVSNITAYLVEGESKYIKSSSKPLSKHLPAMRTGSVPNDGGNLILSQEEAHELNRKHGLAPSILHAFFGSKDFLHGNVKSCLVIGDDQVGALRTIPDIESRLNEVSRLRSQSPKRETREQLAALPHRFQHRGKVPSNRVIIVPAVSSERREWFPAGVLPKNTVVSNLAFIIVDSPLWNLALIVSRLHLVWIATVCGKLKTDPRYSNTLAWNTFPVPNLTKKNRADLTACAENILLAREMHFPTTIAELYDPTNTNAVK